MVEIHIKEPRTPQENRIAEVGLGTGGPYGAEYYFSEYEDDMWMFVDSDVTIGRYNITSEDEDVIEAATALIRREGATSVCDKDESLIAELREY